MSSHNITLKASRPPENVCGVYMFCLLEMKDGVNQRTFFGNATRGRFRMMKKASTTMLRLCGFWAKMKRVCSYLINDRPDRVKFKGQLIICVYQES